MSTSTMEQDAAAPTLDELRTRRESLTGRRSALKAELAEAEDKGKDLAAGAAAVDEGLAAGTATAIGAQQAADAVSAQEQLTARLRKAAERVQAELRETERCIARDEDLAETERQTKASEDLRRKAAAAEQRFIELAADLAGPLRERLAIADRIRAEYPKAPVLEALSLERLADGVQERWTGPCDMQWGPSDHEQRTVRFARWLRDLLCGPVHQGNRDQALTEYGIDRQ